MIKWMRHIILCSGLLFVLTVNASLPTNATKVNWLFSGLIATEGGDQLAYFFQLERDGTRYHSVAALFDVQTREVIFRDESRAESVQTDGYHWSVGNVILRFNPINASWVLGVTTADKRGFNFKIDMLDSEKPLVAEDLRPGLSVLASQTQALNGHIRLSGKSEEQFVIAKHAWFRQMWVTSEQFGEHAVDSVLCHLQDGSSLYSIRLPEADASIGALAGFLNATGFSEPISQFVDVQQLVNGPWDIHVPSTSLHLILSQYTRHNNLIAGFTQDKISGAFCLLGQEQLGSSLGEIKSIS